MRTQEFIHPVNSALLGSSTQGLLAPWTTEQIIDEATAHAMAERKRDRYASRLIWSGPNLQMRARPSAPPIRMPHRWGVVLAGGDGVRMRELTRWLYGDSR